MLNKMLLLTTAGGETPAEDTKKIIDNLKNQLSSGDELIKTLGGIAIALAISFVAIQVYRMIWRRLWKKSPPKLKDKFIYNIVLIILYIIAFIVVIFQLPDGEKIAGGIIAGSGFMAIGIGLAAQESLGNIVNGMMLSVSKPFEVGDRITLVNGNITGYVEDITLRHTVMRTFVNSRIIIPNSTINKEMIENSNYQQGRASAFIDVTITYDSDIDRAKEIMAEIIGNHSSYVDLRKNKKNPKVKVFLRDLGINGLMLRASMWTSSTDNNFEACSDVRYLLHKEFKEAGILFAQVPGRPEAYARAGVSGGS